MENLTYEETLSEDVKRFYELQGKIRLVKTFIVGAVVYHGWLQYYLHGLSLTSLSYFTTAQLPSFFLGFITRDRLCPEYEAIQERLQKFESQLVQAQILEEKKKYTIHVQPERHFYAFDEDGVYRWVVCRDVVYSRRKQEICTVQEREYHLSPGYFPEPKPGKKLVLVPSKQNVAEKNDQYLR